MGQLVHCRQLNAHDATLRPRPQMLMAFDLPLSAYTPEVRCRCFPPGGPCFNAFAFIFNQLDFYPMALFAATASPFFWTEPSSSLKQHCACCHACQLPVSRASRACAHGCHQWLSGDTYQSSPQRALVAGSVAAYPRRTLMIARTQARRHARTLMAGRLALVRHRRLRTADQGLLAWGNFSRPMAPLVLENELLSPMLQLGRTVRVCGERGCGHFPAEVPGQFWQTVLLVLCAVALPLGVLRFASAVGWHSVRGAAFEPEKLEIWDSGKAAG